MTEIITTPGGLVLIGGRLCLDFCNTITERFDEHPIDMLAKHKYQALIHWGNELELLDDDQTRQAYALADVQPEQAAAIFATAVDFRESLYHLFLSRILKESVPQVALDALNHFWHQAMAQRELALQPDGTPGWRWCASETPEIMLWKIAMDAAEVLMQDDLTRIRQCPGCGWLFYDHSRNNSRTWCDMRFCGNRAKNKRFHDRRR